MGWKRTALKGINGREPSSNVKMGHGSDIEDSGIIVNASNKTNYPGAINFNVMDVNFNASSGNWNSDGISRWFRDDGTTTS
jgi:hypothetical protein